jgi:hypothetical protein
VDPDRARFEALFVEHYAAVVRYAMRRVGTDAAPEVVNETFHFPDEASEVNGFVVRPAAFPHDGTLVVEVFFAPGSSTPTGTLSYVVIGRAPTCAQPVYAR